jgi:uncharacterized repeat protein (TIGR01451 family)
VVLTDVLPAGDLHGLDAVAGHLLVRLATRTVTCNLGTITGHARQRDGSVDGQAARGGHAQQHGDRHDDRQWDSGDGQQQRVRQRPARIKFVDLAVSKSVSANPVFAGQNVTYTITVKNINVAISATGVVLTDTLPASMTFVSATTSQGSARHAARRLDGTVTANLGTIAPGATATVTITAKTTSAGNVTTRPPRRAPRATSTRPTTPAARPRPSRRRRCRRCCSRSRS